MPNAEADNEGALGVMGKTPCIALPGKSELARKSHELEKSSSLFLTQKNA